tara:strand:- start:2399 stop:2698 length:300 start_codon:yes stop_codon:yes gene_type:complete
MSQTYNITVSDAQKKCLEFAANGVEAHLQGLAENMARVAEEEIQTLLFAHCNSNDIAIATGAAAQVTQAFDLGLVKTAAQRNADAQAEIAAQEAAMRGE